MKIMTTPVDVGRGTDIMELLSYTEEACFRLFLSFFSSSSPGAFLLFPVGQSLPYDEVYDDDEVCRQATSGGVLYNSNKAKGSDTK